MTTLLCRKNLEYVSDAYEMANTVNIRLCQMKPGTYIVFYRYEWTTLHPERKAIISLHSPHKIELQKIKAEKFGVSDEFMKIDVKNKKRKFVEEEDDTFF